MKKTPSLFSNILPIIIVQIVIFLLVLFFLFIVKVADMLRIKVSRHDSVL